MISKTTANNGSNKIFSAAKPLLGAPTQYFESFKHAQKINFSVYNASMECKLLVNVKIGSCQVKQSIQVVQAVDTN